MDVAYTLAEPPPPRCTIAEAIRAKMKRMPCVYFVWDGDVITYVGKTVKFHQRWLNHHKGYPHDMMISWIEFEEHEITTQESRYIDVLKPRDNHETKLSQPRRRSL